MWTGNDFELIMLRREIEICIVLQRKRVNFESEEHKTTFGERTASSLGILSYCSDCKDIKS
jgi:hypothetical protein